MRLDLHMHTNHSDGALPPEEVVAGAVRGGLDVIAITDHDDASGVAAAWQAAEGRALRVLSGVELSSTHETREVHVLGYGIDPDAAAIREHGDRARRRRRQRMRAMLERLAGQGIKVEMQAVLEAAGAAHPMVGRPHLARVLVDAGYVDSVDAAFTSLIGDEHPAYVPTDLGSPSEVVGVIRAAGGVPVWAHPPGDLLEPLLPELMEAGLEGLEAFRPRWPRRTVRRVVEVAGAHGLCVTGGSDWHGADRNGRIGDFWVTGGQMKRFLERLGMEID